MNITTRGSRTWSERNVPEDLWPEILSRLPVKSLLRFRSVCKTWQAFIDDPNFVRLHLTRFKNNLHQSHLFAIQGTSRKAACVVKSRATLRTTATVGLLESHIRGGNHILCSIDGLFLLIERRSQKLMLLCNPSIQKTVIIAPPEICGSRIFEFGLGFDRSIQDYKVVRFMLGSYPSGVQSVAIYTVGNNSWKSIGFQGKDCSTWRQYFTSDLVGNGHTTFCVKGVLYARARDHVQTLSKLVSFDLSSELFASAALPVLDQYMRYQKLITVDDGSSLAMFYMSGSKEGCIWVLENLGNNIESSSWIPRYTFGPLVSNTGRNVSDISFVCLHKNVELLLSGSTSVLAINLETNEEKIVLKKKFYEGQTWPFVESLLLH